MHFKLPGGFTRPYIYLPVACTFRSLSQVYFRRRTIKYVRFFPTSHSATWTNLLGDLKRKEEKEKKGSFQLSLCSAYNMCSFILTASSFQLVKV